MTESPKDHDRAEDDPLRALMAKEGIAPARTEPPPPPPRTGKPKAPRGVHPGVQSGPIDTDWVRRMIRRGY